MSFKQIYITLKTQREIIYGGSDYYLKRKNNSVTL